MGIFSESFVLFFQFAFCITNALEIKCD